MSSACGGRREVWRGRGAGAAGLLLVLLLTACAPSGSLLARPGMDGVLTARSARGEPGPPVETERVEEALSAGRPAEAVHLLRAQVLEDPELPAPWLRLVMASARGQGVEALLRTEARTVVEAAEEVAPTDDLLLPARAWLALMEGDPGTALGLVGEGAVEVEGRRAWLRARLESGGTGWRASAAVLSLADGDVEACEAFARAAWREGWVPLARDRLARCREAGARSPALGRLEGELAEASGETGLAIERYAGSGALLHAAALASAEHSAEAPDLLRRAVEAGGPPEPLALLQLWTALRQGDEAGRHAALATLEAGQGDFPEIRIARAAAALEGGLPGTAIAHLEGLDNPAASVIRARALLALGAAPEALEQLRAAAAAEPWNVAILRALAAADGGRDEVVARLAAADPVEWWAHRGWDRRDLPWELLSPLGAGPIKDPAWLLPIARSAPAGSLLARYAILLGLTGELEGADPAALAAAGLEARPGDPVDTALAALARVELGEPVSARDLLRGLEGVESAPLAVDLARFRSLAATGAEDEAARLLARCSRQDPRRVALVLEWERLGARARRLDMADASE